MRKRPLGSTGIQVSEIAFGGVEIGMPYGIGKNEMPHPQESIGLLREAFASGINFFDTARLYGQSEQLMGKAFSGIRNDIVLCTKCVHFKKDDGTIPKVKELHRIVHQSLQESLAALQTDYIDVFMLHLADLEILSNEDVLRIFSDLRTSGCVRTIGVSVYTAEETQYAIHSGAWDVIQLPFNLLNQQHGRYFRDAYELGIGIVVRSALMQGLLSDGVSPSHEALQPVNERILQYREIARANQWGLAEMATKFALDVPQVSAVLVGIDRMDYLQEALAVANGKEMPAALHGALASLAYETPDFINLHHWKQQGWI
ncbi:aldo/keto reductase [Parapedobacter sp. 10938]|uniref:aldo/keto reductase n=1 Tax=Parapedobacter flavus TaxID=3110225 RepID=UPI002DB6F9C1|nr:aldo/keto reductase [Parapedobacter sp. 10938]MEC3878593.1 aldo/keto reductase [Parapedobacter sp. 10938]